MAINRQTRLEVNEDRIDLNEFAHEYITRIVICAVSMLKGGEEVKSLVFALKDHKPSLIINEKAVPLSPFPRDAVIGTFTGMVSALKGVNRIESLRIEITSQSGLQ